MKKTILTALIASAGIGAFAQGTIGFSTLTGFSPFPYMYDVDGTTKLGNTFDGQLLISSSATGTFSPVGTAAAFTGGVIVNGGTITTALAAGSTAYFELAAWSISAGSSYSAASQVPGAHVGLSGVFSESLGNVPSAGNPNSPPATMAGATGFKAFGLTTVAVPEPATFTLGALGVAALLIRRRK